MKRAVSRYLSTTKNDQSVSVCKRTIGAGERRTLLPNHQHPSDARILYVARWFE